MYSHIAHLNVKTKPPEPRYRFFYLYRGTPTQKGIPLIRFLYEIMIEIGDLKIQKF